jgi:hypothetical protein
MVRSLRRTAVPALLLIVAACAALPAHATAASSTLAQPVDGTVLKYDDQSAPTSVHVQGTTSGLTGQKVKVVCDHGEKPFDTVGAAMDLDFDDSFHGDIALSDFAQALGPCVLRAVPSTFTGDEDLSSYAGRKVTVARWGTRTPFASGPNTGKVADFLLFQQGSAAGNVYWSIANCGLCRSRLFYPSTFSTSALLWTGNAQVFPNSGGPAYRSQLKVDGRNSMAPGYDMLWARTGSRSTRPTTSCAARRPRTRAGRRRPRRRARASSGRASGSTEPSSRARTAPRSPSWTAGRARTDTRTTSTSSTRSGWSTAPGARALPSPG